MCSVQTIALFRNCFGEKLCPLLLIIILYNLFVVVSFTYEIFIYFFQKTFVILAFSKHYVEAVLSFVG